MMSSISNYQLLVSLLLLCMVSLCHGWVQPPTRFLARQSIALSSSTTINSSPEAVQAEEDEDEDDDEDEYEYVEYDILTEPEFMGSEWLVGTVYERNPNKIQETWSRLTTDKDGKNVAIWGDGAQGTWSFDVANQFLSMSKDNIFGKNIWAGVVEDYYFTYGTVRGWNFFQAAAVNAQWQAKRLGVDPEEAGTPPWFETSDEEESDDEEPPKLEAKADDVAPSADATKTEETLSAESSEEADEKE
jgi:hypothetical protein